MEDHYITLRVHPNASQREIERSYRRLVRAHHPDLLYGAGTVSRQRAEEILKRVNLAYSVLGDPRRRAAYDRERGLRVERARQPMPPRRPTPVETTTHWWGGGPLDIEWTTPPPRRPRPDTDIFTPKRLLRCSIAIVVFTIFLALLWHPGDNPASAPPEPAAVVTPTAAPIPR